MPAIQRRAIGQHPGHRVKQVRRERQHGHRSALEGDALAEDRRTVDAQGLELESILTADGEDCCSRNGERCGAVDIDAHFRRTLGVSVRCRNSRHRDLHGAIWLLRERHASLQREDVRNLEGKVSAEIQNVARRGKAIHLDWCFAWDGDGRSGGNLNARIVVIDNRGARDIEVRQSNKTDGAFSMQRILRYPADAELDHSEPRVCEEDANGIRVHCAVRLGVWSLTEEDLEAGGANGTGGICDSSRSAAEAEAAFDAYKVAEHDLQILHAHLEERTRASLHFRCRELHRHSASADFEDFINRGWRCVKADHDISADAGATTSEGDHAVYAARNAVRLDDQDRPGIADNRQIVATRALE